MTSEIEKRAQEWAVGHWDESNLPENDKTPNDIIEMAITCGITGYLAGATSCAAGPWVSVKERLPDYDRYVLWRNTQGNLTVESLDKDGNPWIRDMEYWAEIREPGDE